MKVKRKKPIDKAAHRSNDKAAVNELNKSYQIHKGLSSLKLFLGETLLFGNKNHKVFWKVLELELRQYVDLRISQNSYDRHYTALISKK